MGLEEDWKIWEKKKDRYESYKTYSYIAFGTAGVFGVGAIGPGIVIPMTNDLPITQIIGIIFGLVGLVVTALVCGVIFRKLYLRDKAAVAELERKYGKSNLQNAAMSERRLNASVRALSEAAKSATFKHYSTNTYNQSSTSSSSGGERYYDAKGILRNPGESYYDYKGTLRNPGEKYYDSKGILRNPGESYFDGRGYLRNPGEGYYDGSGNYHNK